MKATKIINLNGVSLFVKYDYTKYEYETNTPPSVDVLEVHHNECAITPMLNYLQIDEIENLIIQDEMDNAGEIILVP
tara:strand:+ start:204 stop:434 length:231 start_codon:yes stop_codon:yes gene_type:complete